MSVRNHGKVSVLPTSPTILIVIPEARAPGSRGFSKFMEIVGNVGKTNVLHDSPGGKSWNLPTCPTISMNSRPETMAPAPEVSPSSWKFLEVMVTPTFSMIFHDYRNCDFRLPRFGNG